MKTRMRSINLALIAAFALCHSAYANYFVFLPAGNHLFGNHLVHAGGDSVANVFSGAATLPDGTLVTLFNEDSQSFKPTLTYDSSLGIDPGNWYAADGITPVDATQYFIPASGGAFVNPPSSVTPFISGTPTVFQTPATLGRWKLVSRPNDTAGTVYSDIFGPGQPPTSTRVLLLKWNGAMYVPYRHQNGVWSPSAPVMNVGEAVFVKQADGNIPFLLDSASPGCSPMNTITLVFNEDLDLSTLGVPANYQVTGPGNPVVTGVSPEANTTGNPSNRKVTLTLNTSLTAGQTYVVTASGVKDVWGDSLPANTSVKLIASSSPRLLAAVMDCNAPARVILTFDRVMDATSVELPSKYLLHPPSGGVAPVSATLMGEPSSGNRVLLTFIGGLNANTLYTINAINVASSCGAVSSPKISFVCGQRITGKKYLDQNGDGTKQTTEPGMQNWLIRLDSPSLAAPLFALTDATGKYGFSVPDDVYTVSEIQQPGWAQTQPVSGGNYILGPTGFPFSGKNFGNQTTTSSSDLTVDMAVFFDPPYKSPCCGQNMYCLVSYRNIGTTTLSAPRIRMTHHKYAKYISVIGTPAVTVYAQDNLGPDYTWEKWQLPGLNPGDSGYLLITYNLNTGAPQNCVGTPPPLITAIARGIHPLLPSAYAGYKQKATCSLDPNDKTVSPRGCGPEGYIHRDLPLTYTIQFQNTGTGPAYRVVLRDVLDTDLNPNTVLVVGQSHPGYLQVNGQELVWTFDNINLPESSFDEPGSHGYVKFTVQPQPALPAGRVITNSAAIYFDLNTPVITATTTNTITDDPLPIASFTGPTVPIDVGAPVNFTYTGGTPGATFLWNLGEGATPATSTSANPTGVTYSSSGFKQVTLEVTLGDCTSEAALSLVGIGTPLLSASKSGTNLNLTWTDENFRLQETTTVHLPDSWEDSTATLSVTGGTVQAQVPLSEPQKFYRLILE